MAQNKKTSSQNKSAKPAQQKGKPGPKPKATSAGKQHSSKAAPKKKAPAKKAVAKKPAPKKAAPKKSATAQSKTTATSNGVDVDVWTAFGMDEMPLSKAIDPIIAKAEASADSAIAAASVAKTGIFARIRAWLRSA